MARRALSHFRRDEQGSILTFWAFALVIFLGLLGVTFDVGRMAATQTELQSYADAVALAAAGELDGRADAMTRAERAAALIADSQTFGLGAQALGGAGDYRLTFLSALPADDRANPDAFATTDPHRAHFVWVETQDRSIGLGFGAAFAALAGSDQISNTVNAGAVAGFEQQACDTAPITVCLPSLDFRAEAHIGKTLALNANAGLGINGLGGVAATVSDLLPFDELGLCAGLLGDLLQTCLLAAKTSQGACTPGKGLEIDVELGVAELDAALNVRFGSYTGIAAGLAGNPNFGPAANVLAGAVNGNGLCIPSALPLTGNALGLPTDDCQRAGTCGVLGNGSWTQGRTAYVNAHYKGSDPHPGARTRYDYYKAEVAAQAASGNAGVVGSVVGGLLNGGLVGGLVGGLLGGPKPLLCTPVPPVLPERRLLVAAAIDCSQVAGRSLPPVRQYFEVFMLGPSERGLLNVEIVGCLGGRCGGGETDTTVRDVVRLHR